jgi:hypothetical protein
MVRDDLASASIHSIVGKSHCEKETYVVVGVYRRHGTKDASGLCPFFPEPPEIIDPERT